MDLNCGSSGCARLGGEVALPLGVVKEEEAVLIALVRRHRFAVGAVVRRVVDDEVPGAVGGLSKHTRIAANRKATPLQDTHTAARPHRAITHPL